MMNVLKKDVSGVRKWKMGLIEDLKNPPKDWQFYARWVGIGLIVASVIMWSRMR